MRTVFPAPADWETGDTAGWETCATFFSAGGCMKSWLLLNSGPQSAACNMAADEALLEAMPRLQQPVLRLYGWTEPAATFGYFQHYTEVSQRTLLRPLVRRPTGGGIVPHDADWTYSLAFPAGHEWHGLAAVESYRRVHEWIQAAFRRLNVVTELAPDARHSAPGACFEGYEKSDVLWHGRKIAGAAQRRNKLGLLIQGSIQPPSVGLVRGEWEQALRAVAQNDWSVEWIEFLVDENFGNQARRLAVERYSRDEHNQKR